MYDIFFLRLLISSPGPTPENRRGVTGRTRMYISLRQRVRARSFAGLSQQVRARQRGTWQVATRRTHDLSAHNTVGERARLRFSHGRFSHVENRTRNMILR